MLRKSMLESFNEWKQLKYIFSYFESFISGYKASDWGLLKSIKCFIKLNGSDWFGSFLLGLILVGGFERAFSIASQGDRIEFDKSVD